jgi:predicted nucleic acid-binding protein
MGLAVTGVFVTGVLGLLLLSKKVGLLNSIRDEVDRLVAGGFHISPSLCRSVISRAGEG